MEMEKPKNLAEIHLAIKEFMPGKQTTARKTLEEGMRKAKEIQESYDKARGDFTPGDFNPARLPLQEVCNVDLLISRRLGARRIGSLIEWTVKEGKFQFNWVSGEVKKV